MIIFKTSDIGVKKVDKNKKNNPQQFVKMFEHNWAPYMTVESIYIYIVIQGKKQKFLFSKIFQSSLYFQIFRLYI